MCRLRLNVTHIVLGYSSSASSASFRAFQGSSYTTRATLLVAIGFAHHRQAATEGAAAIGILECSLQGSVHQRGDDVQWHRVSHIGLVRMVSCTKGAFWIFSSMGPRLWRRAGQSQARIPPHNVSFAAAVPRRVRDVWRFGQGSPRR